MKPTSKLTKPITISRPISELDYFEAEAELIWLASAIEQYNNAYYGKNTPLVTDAEYDALFQRNILLEEKFPLLKMPNSPSEKIGSSVAKSRLKKIQHKLPMLSLTNCFSIGDVQDFIDKAKRFLSINHDIEIFCDPKIDGLSFSAMYKNGSLHHVSTRGNGFEGEEITENMKTIQNFPINIDTAIDELEIRGEIFLTRQEFDRINREREKKQLPLFANPRNAAAGSIRQLDVNVTKSRKLEYIAYSVGFYTSELANTQEHLINELKKLGFNINNNYCKTSDINTMEIFYDKLYNDRVTIPYDIDGIVYKVNDFLLQNRLGFIARSPRFATAHKFPAEQAQTKIKDISIQVGRTGALTPVAELEPINIGGVIVRRATLHNQDEINRKDTRIGDTVIIERSGDVIPHIISVNLQRRPKNTIKFIIPNKCPVCNSDAKKDDAESVIRCTGNLQCKAQILERLIHFASKKAFDINGLGQKQVIFLYENKYIITPVDIFHLTEIDSRKNFTTQLEYNDRWGKKSVENLYQSIETSKNVSLSRFIYSLGIRHVGEVTAKLIAQQCKSFEVFYNNIVDNKQSIIANDLSLVDGIGFKVIDSISDFCKSEHNRKIIKDLGAILNIENYKEVSTTSSILNGKKIVFTGSLVNTTRAEAKAKAESLGAKVLSAVSSSADYVVAGESAGSKLKKAQELNIKILTEQEWFNIQKS